MINKISVLALIIFASRLVGTSNAQEFCINVSKPHGPATSTK